MINYKQEIERLKKELDVTIVAHFYQKDEVFEMGDIVGDSLELAKKAKNAPTKNIIFCGVGFMGESVKVLAPEKRVLMPKVACCAMAKMIDVEYFNPSTGESTNVPVFVVSSVGVESPPDESPPLQPIKLDPNIAVAITLNPNDFIFVIFSPKCIFVNNS